MECLQGLKWGWIKSNLIQCFIGWNCFAVLSEVRMSSNKKLKNQIEEKFSSQLEICNNQ